MELYLRATCTLPLIDRGHIMTRKGEHLATRGITTSPDIPSTGDYPAARGMTTSPLIGRGHTATFGSEVPRYARHDAVARNYIYGRVPRCAGHDDLPFNTQTNHPLIHTNQGVVSMDGAQT